MKQNFYFKKFKIKFEKTTLSKVALKISQGKVIGRFQAVANTDREL